MSTAVEARRRRIRRYLPVSVAAPGQARRLVEAITELADYADIHFAAQILTSELVANAVRHSRSRAGDVISFALELEGESIRVEIGDPGLGFDPLRCLAHHRSRQEHYHGIFLTNVLADRWGYRRGETGFCVWFEFDLVPGRRPWRGREPVA